MNRQQAIAIVKETFTSAFDRQRYIHFIKNLLNQYDDEDARSNQGALIPDKFQNYVEKLERVGKYLVDDDEVMLFIVYLKSTTSIERARTMQRNFIASYLQRDMKDAALVAFVSKDPADWRFSFIKMEYRYDEQKNKIKEEFSPAKRWSFLVGEHEASHTAQRKLAPIMEDDERNPTLTDLEEAFNIEKVTKEFFEKYRGLFIRTKDELDRVVANDPILRADFEGKGIDTVNFAKKLLGQIIFLYYLQKKGWFGVARNARWGEGSKNFLRELFDKKHGVHKNFFNDILEQLFYDALRRDRSEDDHYYPAFKCKIPFLNGGLFDPMNNYDWVNTDLKLPNELFHNKTKTKEGDDGDGILDIFDRYNFTVKEDEPFEKEVAIDPELLGKAYEKFNAIRPDNYEAYLLALKSGKKGEESQFNKKYGVYYTPREIVHFMCQQSLINYLYSELNGNLASEFEAISSGVEIVFGDEHDRLQIGISKEDISTLILKGEQIKEHDERVEAIGRETGTYSFQLPESIRRNATLIDNKLANIKVCDPAVGSGAFPVGMMSEIVRARDVLRSWTKTETSLYDFKRGCIENSLYGVDIDPGAVEIAKLRLWLSLVVDEDDIHNIKPLPNLDYKISAGNSLLGLPDGILLDLELKNKLEEQKKKYFHLTNPNTKLKMREEISNLFSNLVESAKQYDPSLSNIDFDYHTHFSEVFHDDKGFDVIIANPPYVGEKGNKETFREIRKGNLKAYYQGKMDLFYFFFHLAINISKPRNGSIAFISTNYYPTATGGKKLREDLKKRTTILNLINLNELKIFESALGQHNLITMLSTGNNVETIAKTCITNRKGGTKPEILQSIFQETDDGTDYYKIKQQDLYDGSEHYLRLTGTTSKTKNSSQTVLDKVKKQGLPLVFLCNINSGADVSISRITKSHITKFRGEFSIGDGVFVLNKKEAESLNTDSNEVAILKPFIKNSNIDRYFVSKTTDRLIYLQWGDDINDYPNIKKHILRFKKILVDQQERYEENYPWFALHRPREQRIFEANEKILVPYRNRKNVFGFATYPIYSSRDVFYITNKTDELSLKYILALLNSKLYYLWYFERGKRKGEMLELYQTPLSETPIKKISNDKQESFIKLVDCILAARRGNPQADTSKLEGEIDQLVYQLYGLTEEEILLVEGE